MAKSETGKKNYDVAIIGAGPSGAVAAANLAGKGHSVLVLEKETFPRFSIGESLLPQCMIFLEEAEMLAPVEQAKFQIKNGAVFERAGTMRVFNFSEKFTAGPYSTYEVLRSRFDKILADKAERLGTKIQYGCEINNVKISGEGAILSFINADDQLDEISAHFCLDASGFGRILPRLLDLDRPSQFPNRQSLFTHITDNISASDFDREKILITIHPEKHDVWFWLIPFSDGTSSIGVVAREEFFATLKGDDQNKITEAIGQAPNLSGLLSRSEYKMPLRTLRGYASSVTQLYGQSFALLGNAGEFLDPIFSSGVTIALKSASLASKVLDKQLRGQKINWEKEFAAPLSIGIETFRHFVESWYNQDFQDIIFHDHPNPQIREMICSILAGYAWDETNPYVQTTQKRLRALAQICREQKG